MPQVDLESHVDFDGWQYLPRNSTLDPTEINKRKPVVYFGSFQDLLGHHKAGNIKPKTNEHWIVVSTPAGTKAISKGYSYVRSQIHIQVRRCVDISFAITTGISKRASL